MALTLFSALADFVGSMWDLVYSIYISTSAVFLLLGAFLVFSVFRFIVFPFVNGNTDVGEEIRESRARNSRKTVGGFGGD